MDNQASRFCAKCQRIDVYELLDQLTKIIQSDGGTQYIPRPIFLFGSLATVRASAVSCDLCTYILSAITDTPSISKSVTKHGNDKGVEIYLAAMQHWRAVASSGEPSARTLASMFRLQVHIRSEQPQLSDFTEQILQPSVWPVPGLETAHRGFSEEKPLGHGRFRPQVVDDGLLQSWLRQCELAHDPCRWNGPRPTIKIRLIDVHKLCLQEFVVEEKSSVRYVCLSYVWGRVKQETKLNAAELEAFYAPGTIELNRLPRTVVDCIQLVMAFGLQYLWVDALCVIQDDPDDVVYQLSIMGHIYARGLLTIAAAVSKDANSGLPGVSERPRQTQKVFGPLKNACALMTLCECEQVRPLVPFRSVRRSVNPKYLRDTEWEYRGWTFQEKIMSRRILYVLEEQMYWECQCARWCEETCLETLVRTRIHGRGKAFEGNDSALGSFVSEQLRSRVEADMPLGTDSERLLRDTIEDFTSRRLSFEHDTHRAIAGTLQMFSEFTGTKFFYGLPTSSFDSWFSWDNNREGSHSKKGSQFPSWSWYAWNGGVELGRKEDKTAAPAISFVDMDAEGQKDLVRVDPSSASPVAQVPKRSDITPGMWNSLRENFHVIFWTESVMLYVEIFGAVHLSKDDDENYMGHLSVDTQDLEYRTQMNEFIKVAETETHRLGKRIECLLITWHEGIARREASASLKADIWAKLTTRKQKLIVMG